MHLSRTLRILMILTVSLCLILPSVAMAKKKKKGRRRVVVTTQQHGIGAGGVPALRDMLLSRIQTLDTTVLLLDARLLDLELRLQELEDLATDDDMDGFSENQGDCDDTLASVFPGATEDPTNGIDDDCDGLIDEIDLAPGTGGGTTTL